MTRARSIRLVSGRILVFLPAALTCLSVAGQAATPRTDASQPIPVADLLVVDCLLPGQIRQLGQRTTYVSPRRPVRTTGRDCQIRGGEYVAYDRANLQTALNVWLPAAQQGDAEASTVVGEMFEKGLGVPADYRAAAEWYRKAAALGDTRARIDLGHLYEKGLGVARDPVEALHWYRLAAGLDAGIELDGRGLSEPGEVDSLRRQLSALQDEASGLRQSLEKARLELELALRAARETQVPPAPPPAQEPPPAIEAPPAEPPAPRSSAPEDTARIATLSADVEAGARQVAELTRLLADSQAQLTGARAELDAARVDQERRAQELAASGAAVDEQRRFAEDGRRRLDAMELALQQRESELAAQRAEAEGLRAQLARVQAEAAARQERIAQLEQPPAPVAPTVPMPVAGPELAIIEPQVLATRGIEIVVAGAAPNGVRQIIGQVTAPAGLLRLAVNDSGVEPNELGVFTADVPVSAADTPVTVVAIDRQGKRSVVEFVLRARVAADASAVAQSKAQEDELSGIDFGRYHALVIGNDDYRHLPDLKTAVADATEVAGILESRYGFSTTLLTDANRYEILAALNSLRERLTRSDNLLIYYAGHGELDEVNNRGHWLPVDAEPESTANWISAIAVTDILNIMQARQILLVVDSCYSGALTRSSVARLAAGMTGEERLHWLRTVSQKRSRTVLTSGGLAPVLDSGGGSHSVFARALLEVLGGNDEVLDGHRLHREVAARVSYAADNVGFDQVPEYAPIRYAGHEAGEFFFVPKR